jgi:hypothetical protein
LVDWRQKCYFIWYHFLVLELLFSWPPSNALGFNVGGSLIHISNTVCVANKVIAPLLKVSLDLLFVFLDKLRTLIILMAYRFIRSWFLELDVSTRLNVIQLFYFLIQLNFFNYLARLIFHERFNCILLYDLIWVQKFGIQYRNRLCRH